MSFTLLIVLVAKIQNNVLSPHDWTKKFLISETLPIEEIKSLIGLNSIMNDHSVTMAHPYIGDTLDVSMAAIDRVLKTEPDSRLKASCVT